MSATLSVSEVRICPKHGNYDAEGYTLTQSGLVLWTGCPKCIEEREAADWAKERDRELSRLAERGLVGRLTRMTFDSYQAETEEQRRALDRCCDFAAAPGDRTLVLVGGVGTGKTHLAVAIAQAVCGAYVPMMRLIRDIRDAYRPGAKVSEQDRIDRWAREALLVIDEVGVQHSTDAERLLIYEVINERYVYERPTVLVSNETVAEMGKILGERVMDRLAERGEVVAFTWGSWRRR